jgi:hypothetical protein
LPRSGLRTRQGDLTATCFPFSDRYHLVREHRAGHAGQLTISCPRLLHLES